MENKKGWKENPEWMMKLSGYKKLAGKYRGRKLSNIEPRWIVDSETEHSLIEELVSDLCDYGFCSTKKTLVSFISRLKAWCQLMPFDKPSDWRDRLTSVPDQNAETSREYLHKVFSLIKQWDAWAPLQLALCQHYAGVHDDVVCSLKDVMACFFVPAWYRLHAAKKE